MKAILDTHVFLWWIADAPQLSEKVRSVLGNTRNQFFFSAASGWEIAVKAALGKLTLPQPPERFVTEQLRRNAFQTLPIELYHALYVYRLPRHHRDPFDRLLIAQGILEKMAIVTRDETFSSYGVATLW